MPVAPLTKPLKNQSGRGCRPGRRDVPWTRKRVDAWPHMDRVMDVTPVVCLPALGCGCPDERKLPCAQRVSHLLQCCCPVEPSARSSLWRVALVARAAKIPKIRMEKTMSQPKIVSQVEWTKARKALLEKEKAFSRERDAIAAARRELPMVKVEKPYAFEGPSGKKSLASLFDGKRQLITYHFMFDPSWEEGCKSCSLVADHFEGMLPHLGARDVSFTAISRAPFAKLQAFQKRMGWKFPWVSSSETDFNYDYGVSFNADDKSTDKPGYNYGSEQPTSERPGLSVFLRSGDDVFHTYSTYARGLDVLIGAYNYIDVTPIGRNEKELEYGMAWVKHHDKY